MPATIIGSSEWNTKGIVLSTQSAQEQVNGLVNVQIQYNIPATKQEQLDRFFYPDAPPPIWPTVVNRAEMLTGNLYMTTRSVDRRNGLVQVDAEYVGGLMRSGFAGYYLWTQNEGQVFGSAYIPSSTPPTGPAGAGLITTNGIISLTGTTLVRFRTDIIVHNFEYVEIGQQSAVAIPAVERNTLLRPQPGRSIERPHTVEEILNAPVILVGEGAYFKDAEFSRQRQETEKYDYLTPQVKVVTKQYFL